MSNETGGPAFPQPAFASQNSSTGETVNHQWLSDGMTLRDYFAAKAVHAYLADPNASWGFQELDKAAGCAYRVADAMLKARKQ